MSSSSGFSVFSYRQRPFGQTNISSPRQEEREGSEPKQESQCEEKEIWKRRIRRPVSSGAKDISALLARVHSFVAKTIPRWWWWQGWWRPSPSPWLATWQRRRCPTLMLQARLLDHIFVLFVALFSPFPSGNTPALSTLARYLFEYVSAYDQKCFLFGLSYSSFSLKLE